MMKIPMVCAATILLAAAALAQAQGDGDAGPGELEMADARCRVMYGLIAHELRTREGGGALFGIPPAQTSVHADEAEAAHEGTHGQLIFGEGPFYLGHLPFVLASATAHPHNFQVLVRVGFVDPADEAAYLERRESAPDTILTAVPETFSQDWLRSIYRERLEHERFDAVELYEGHFEAIPRPPAFASAALEIEEVVHFRELGLEDRLSEALQYLLLDDGSESGAFLVHLIDGLPSFDATLEVTLGEARGDGTATERLGERLHGAFVVVDETRTNREADRLGVGDRLECAAFDGTRRMPFDLRLEVRREIYCEAGELSGVVGTEGFEGQRRCSGAG